MTAEDRWAALAGCTRQRQCAVSQLADGACGPVPWVLGKLGVGVNTGTVKHGLLALLGAALFVGCGGRSQDDSIESAKQALERRDSKVAVIELKTLLQTAPNSGEARYLLGRALFEQGDCAAALLELMKAQELGFDNNLVLPKQARCLLGAAKLKEVVQLHSGVKLTSAGAQADLSATTALALAALNQRVEAEATLREALRSDPNSPWALLTKARFDASTGKFDEALATIDRVVGIGYASGDAQMLRGTVLQFGKKDVSGAIKAYEAAAADPREALGARSAMIRILLAQKKLPEAKQQLAVLQRAHPKAVQTLYVAAIVSYVAKDYGRAEAIVDQVLGTVPNSVPLLVLGGAASMNRGNLVGAEAKLGKVIQTVERMPVARKLLADTYLRMGRPEKALGVVQPLVEQASPDGDALALAGQAHLQLGRAKEAEMMFSAAAKLKPQDVQVRTALALTDLVKGNAEAAYVALQDIAVKDPGETADLALISAHLKRGEFDAALVAIANLQKKQADKPLASHLRGVALAGKSDLAGARAAFESALKIAPTHFPSILSLSGLDVQEKRPDAAQQRLVAAVKADPKNVAPRMALVDLMHRQKAKPSDLLAVIEEAVVAFPSEAAPRVALISQLSAMNDVKGAALAAQNALAAVPQHPEVLDAAGRAIANAGDDQQALGVFNKLANASNKSALPYLRLADLHAKRGDTAAVVANLNRAFEQAPTSAEVHKRMLAQAARTRDYKLVLAAAKELQHRNPKSAAGYLLEGDAEASRKGWAAALAAYRQALKAADGAGRPPKLIHATMRASGDRAGAERFASEWLKSDAKDAGFREYLGGEAVLHKDFVAAERHFRDALALQPQNGMYMNNLAWVMAERRMSGAVELAERALALAPGAGPVLDTLAKALAADGQFERAIDVQKMAIEALPDRHVYRLSLARHLLGAGRIPQAAAELDALSKLGDKFPGQPAVAELRARLTK